MSDQEIFDAALSDAPVDTTVTETAPTTEQVAEKPAIIADQTGRLHDPATGKFAPKTAAEVTAEAQPQEQQPQPEDTTGAIPAWRMAEVTRERNELREQAAQLRAMMSQLQQQQPRQEQQPPPDAFENPSAHARYEARQEIDPQLRKINEVLTYNSKLVAYSVHSKDAVEAAEKAFNQAAQDRTIDLAEYHKVQDNPNPFEAAVNWHKRLSAMTAIGGDLDAYNAKQQEALLSDPAFLAKAVERVRTGQNTNGSRPANVVQLPPSLNKATSASGALLDDAGDMNGASLYASAISR